ncbi:MAG: ABC transporter ATP-binding protein [Anaerolineales bacterium]|jgi:lipopolysaccharide transport system ATP-binding protein|nr:ABC transporter ATP-binding protein [Anaerolineales bacterium]
MNTDTLIKVESVSKKFCRSLKRSLWYGVQDIGTELIGRSKSQELRQDEFWAVKDVNFELRRGECLGLVGHNGAGKSTLLKMLNGLIKPDQGSITMKGRVGALIELGTGFNPILTGRENIYSNGAVLGFTKKEIDQKFDAIVDFSEIGDFLDTPVQNYSSGMKVRLGFAVAAQMEPDILLIDEVLAVGDMRFRLKSFNLIDHLVERCSVIFVSHSMQNISRMCNQILLMENGREKYTGSNVSEGIDEYYQSLGSGHTDFFHSDSDFELLKIMINESEDELPLVKRLDDLIITLCIEINSKFENTVASVIIFDYEQKSVGICMNDNPINSIGEVISRHQGKTRIEINVKIPRINLSKGIYYITFTLTETLVSKPVTRLNNIKTFQVTSLYDVWPPFELEGVWYKKSDGVK